MYQWRSRWVLYQMFVRRNYHDWSWPLSLWQEHYHDYLRLQPRLKIDVAARHPRHLARFPHHLELLVQQQQEETTMSLLLLYSMKMRSYHRHRQFLPLVTATTWSSMLDPLRPQLCCFSTPAPEEGPCRLAAVACHDDAKNS